MANEQNRQPALIAFADRQAMADKLATLIETALARALAERGAASLAVSGGSTPAALYKALSGKPLDWARVTVALADERWTPPDTEGSNETFVRRTLLQSNAAAATLIGLWSPAPSPTEGRAAAKARLEKTGAFDVAILGMGADGHTASWFPYAEGLSEALSGDDNMTAAIAAKPNGAAGAHLHRLTLTLPALRSAGLICLMTAGAEKRHVYETALEDGPVEAMPVRAILRARPDLWASWAP